MSWFFGIIKSGVNTEISQEYIKIHYKPLYTFSSQNFYIALGGINETCLFEVNEETQTGWAVLGLGIRLTESGAQFLTKDDWRNLLTSKASGPVSELDGHYTAIRWSNDEIEFFTDQFELRTGYYSKCEIGYCFSSRLDWVAQLRKSNEINKAFLGGRWLLFNQLNYESGVTDIERFGPAANIIIKKGQVIKKEFKQWLPVFEKKSDTSYAKMIMESFVSLSLKTNRTLSLALSGGLDSRTLLAILLANKNSYFLVHTFGDPNDPDVQISERIAFKYGLQRQYFNEPFPDSDTLISLLNTFTAENLLVEPCSSILKLRYYSIQHNKNQLIIDGANGEIARRQYLNRFVKLGRSAIRTKNIPSLFRLLHIHRADIFSAEYKDELEKAALNSLDDVLNVMPPINEIGVENFVDLFIVRTRLPNYAGPEQTRSDAFAVNYMPMIQPSFAKAVFKVDIKQRKNGRMFRDIIQKKVPTLKNFPLVKSGLTYPFFLKTNGAWLFTKIKSKIRGKYTDSTHDQFLTDLRHYVLDLAHSNDVKCQSFYNHKQIQSNIDAYYKGEKNLGSYVIWWLTFELWRRSILKKD